MNAYIFDDSHIQWHKLEGIDHLEYSILGVDKINKIVDVLFKLAPNKQILLHRHKAHNNCFVVQGEHRLYKPNGELKEIRATGSYTSNPADNNPHRECGGNQGAVVLFSIRGSNGIFYEILNNEQNIIGTLSMQDFVDLYELQKE